MGSIKIKMGKYSACNYQMLGELGNAKMATSVAGGLRDARVNQAVQNVLVSPGYGGFAASSNQNRPSNCTGQGSFYTINGAYASYPNACSTYAKRLCSE